MLMICKHTRLYIINKGRNINDLWAYVYLWAYVMLDMFMLG